MGTAKGSRRSPGSICQLTVIPPGNAFHGTYWHDNFGLQMSHGCVNMRTDEAKWLFRWSTPVFKTPIESHQDWEQRGMGTLVIIT